jgi:hypothetical protein
VLAFIASAVAWWFLTGIVTESDAPRSLMRRALVGIMLEELFAAISTLAYVFVFPKLTFAWPIVGNGLIGLGDLVGAVGFLSMLLTYRDGSPQTDRRFADWLRIRTG